MARLLTPELAAELAAAIDTPPPGLEANDRPTLDQLAGEIATLDVAISEAQANSELPPELPEIDAADRHLAEAEGRARVLDCIADNAELVAAKYAKGE
jgi:hypothetical protein